MFDPQARSAGCTSRRPGSRTSGRAEGTVPGEDSAFFYFPPIEDEFGSPVLGCGDQFLMFEDRPEVRALVEYLATPEAAASVDRGRRLRLAEPSGPAGLGTPTYPTTSWRPILAESRHAAFRRRRLDAGGVGPVFRAGMVDWIAANGEGTEDVFAEVEANWPE